MAGTIIADTLTHSTAGSVTTDYVVNGSAKAWVRIDSSATMSAQNSLNLSSLTDGGTGKVEMYFSSSFNNAEYAGAGMAGNDGLTASNRSQVVDSVPATGNFHFRNVTGQTTAIDDANIMMAIHGDLA